ncbi:MAG: hypothetical protein N5P05_003857 [Chroococcopsis gigantea SAG 12.99]|jgi:hypothetical protein|nr:DUF4089 domain-containing protein [Chlorogloea purpurea SAG 13.99]MDV3002251.1 hypothetical protein [Chroococcopsis gigantea SAG 12.99]
MNRDNLTLYLRLTSEIIALPIPEEYVESVVINLERMENLAQLVMDFEIDDTIEIAPIFQP